MMSSSFKCENIHIYGEIKNDTIDKLIEDHKTLKSEMKKLKKMTTTEQMYNDIKIIKKEKIVVAKVEWIQIDGEDTEAKESEKSCIICFSNVLIVCCLHVCIWDFALAVRMNCKKRKYVQFANEKLKHPKDCMILEF